MLKCIVLSSVSNFYLLSSFPGYHQQTIILHSLNTSLTSLNFINHFLLNSHLLRLVTPAPCLLPLTSLIYIFFCQSFHIFQFRCPTFRKFHSLVDLWTTPSINYLLHLVYFHCNKNEFIRFIRWLSSMNLNISMKILIDICQIYIVIDASHLRT